MLGIGPCLTGYSVQFLFHINNVYAVISVFNGFVHGGVSCGAEGEDLPKLPHSRRLTYDN